MRARPDAKGHLEGGSRKDLRSRAALASFLEFWKQKNGGEARGRSKMEKYRLVEEHKGEGEDFLEQTSESEVRITQQGKPRNYISYAMNLFVSLFRSGSCVVL